MSLHTIRTFRFNSEIYRHATCANSDAVFLQRDQNNPDATCDDDLWTTLLVYDRHCVARDAQGNKVGDFQIEGGPNHWVFYESPNRTRIDFGPINGTEALLDAEVLYSRRWLVTQELQSQEYAGTLAHAAQLQAEIDALANKRDDALRPHADALARMVHDAKTPSELLPLIVNLRGWPMGFYRSELRIIQARRLVELSTKKKTVPAGAAKTTPPIMSSSKRQVNAKKGPKP